MKRKKLVSLVLAAGLVVGIVGGSLAWFTSSDEVTNKFSIASTDDPGNINSGIKVDEVFDTTDGTQDNHVGNVLPGDTIQKKVRVKNTASYDQLIRVKFEKVWKDKDGNVVEREDLNKDLIELDFGKNLTPTGKWIDNTITDNYYYFNEIVAPEGFTDYILENVKLSSKADNKYKNLKFDVVVKADSIQASNGAAEAQWGSNIPDEIKALGK